MSRTRTHLDRLQPTTNADKLSEKINTGQHEQVPGQMKRWTRAGGKVLKGLERQQEAEAA